MHMKMVEYRNLKGDSGVTAYEFGPGYIRVRFIDGEIYRYTNKSAGKKHIEQMQHLAVEGKGLSTYISQFVRDKYECREGHSRAQH